jgi:ATP-dependent DNA ligase
VERKRKMNVEDSSYVYPPKPLYVPPTSALFKELDNDQRWVAETKKNGWRCMVRYNGKVSLWTRHRTLVTDALPTLRESLKALQVPPDSILDGELLEHRSQTKETYMVWGIIKWRGEWMHTVPYSQIREMLAELLREIPVSIIRPACTTLNKVAFYNTVIREKENEGVVLKRLDKPVPFFHNDAKEISSWLKVKPAE